MTTTLLDRSILVPTGQVILNEKITSSTRTNDPDVAFDYHARSKCDAPTMSINHSVMGSQI